MHPGLIKAFYDIGKQLAEDGIITGSTLTTPSGDELDRQIKEVREQLMAASPGTAAYAALEQKRDTLYRTKYGTGPANRIGDKPAA
jgi:hypothetical protein